MTHPTNARGTARSPLALLLALPPAVAACDAAPGADGLPEVEEPTLWCPEPVVAFGEVWEGSVLERELRFHVLGDEPIAVHDVRADCGCTVARLERVAEDGGRVAYEEGVPLSPGAELALTVRYDTHGKAGSGERVITLFCDEPDGVSRVVLRADVRPRFQSEPDPIPSAILAEGESRELAFDVVGTTDEPVRLVHRRDGLPEAVDVRLAPVDPDASGRSRRWRVEVVIGPEVPRGTHSYPIRLAAPGLPLPGAEAEEAPEASFVPVLFVRVLGPFTVAPPTMAFGMVAPGEAVARTVRVRCNEDGFAFAEPAVRIEALAGRPIAWADHAEVHTRPVEGEHAWDVELVLPGLPAGEERSFLGQLLVETGHPVEPLVDVKINGFRTVVGGGATAPRPGTGPPEGGRGDRG